MKKALKTIGLALTILALTSSLVWPKCACLGMGSTGLEGAAAILAGAGHQVKLAGGAFEGLDVDTLSYTAHVHGIHECGLLFEAWITVEHGLPVQVVIRKETGRLTI